MEQIPLYSKIPITLLTSEQKDSLFKGVYLEGFPIYQKEILMCFMIETVLNRVFARILPHLTETDLETILSLEQKVDFDEALTEFLVVKVPVLDIIIEEEIINVRFEVKEALKTAYFSVC